MLANAQTIPIWLYWEISEEWKNKLFLLRKQMIKRVIQKKLTLSIVSMVDNSGVWVSSSVSGFGFYKDSRFIIHSFHRVCIENRRFVGMSSRILNVILVDVGWKAMWFRMRFRMWFRKFRIRFWLKHRPLHIIRPFLPFGSFLVQP